MKSIQRTTLQSEAKLSSSVEILSKFENLFLNSSCIYISELIYILKKLRMSCKQPKKFTN